MTENESRHGPGQARGRPHRAEPITDANVGAAMDGPATSEEEHEVVLHEEEVVAEKRAVPKERVRLDKDVPVAEETSTRTCARSIEVDDAAGTDRR